MVGRAAVQHVLLLGFLAGCLIQAPHRNSIYPIALRAVRSAYSICRFLLPFLLRSRSLSSSFLICSKVSPQPAACFAQAISAR